MGMGGTGVSQIDIQKMQLLNAKGERSTLAQRISVTSKSIEILESSGPERTEPVEGKLSHIEAMLSAIILANLEQLRGNLKEGNERFDYLDKAIASAESPIKKAIIVPPGQRNA